MDLDVEGNVAGTPQTLISKKLQHSEVDNSKGKTKISYEGTWQDQVKDASASDPGNSTVVGSLDSVDPLKSTTSGSINSNNLNSSTSDITYNGYDENANGGGGDDDGGSYEDDDYVSDYDDNDDFLYDDGYIGMQSQFDNVDLPPGIEVSLPWLNDSDSSANIPVSTRTLIVSDLPESKMQAAAASSSIIPTELSSKEKEEENGDTVMGDVLQFKQFNIGDDFSDHHYSRMGFSDGKAPKNWAKRIQDEWKMLETNLPDTIFVRVYEARMELLRAVMIGPAGTPYHDGLFVFDCLFPDTYPSSPPMVYYYSGGLRLNPNLYDCGKVCLSLLGTWTGKPNEMWIPDKSTMLQVLVSIQALILNAKPFFNEPGYEKTYIGPEGERRSLAYNENAFILSLKTMIYTLRRPPKQFEDFVASHFRRRARDILAACKAYMEGAPVGFVDNEGAQDNAGGDPKSIEFKSKVDKMMNMMPGGDPKSIEFKSKLGKMMNMLVTSFTKNGSTDIEQFRLPA
ncbi:putative ubiquitin-conjugating enzyme E2 38 [Corylus avellana]|uniref:putative ubiquitin-conjugating enzyme E2 38 n=1 Tax=Corylus avellana TaxID=13451 RepID=UPI00286D0A0B|nr:putative ubiquitin-conjugating enzyme E2 38 [Corylus avellana]